MPVVGRLPRRAPRHARLASHAAPRDAAVRSGRRLLRRAAARKADSGAGTGCLIAVVVVVVLVLLGGGGVFALGYWGYQQNEKNEAACADPSLAGSRIASRRAPASAT